jgi:NAD(P)-dependent dehydrogenase (short-subunit alcohol dehydrogenase family)
MPNATSRQLEGKAALVTGAGRGIGQGIATVLASRGASVAVSDLNEAACVETVALIRSNGGTAAAIAADVTSQASIDAAAAGAIAEFGKLDIAVANAGVYSAAGGDSRLSYNEADWDVTFAVNVKGLAHTADAVAAHMKERRSGRIIIIASHGGRAPRGPKVRPGTVGMPYGASKAAAIQFTHALAIELAQHNINVNCVCPGNLWTPMWEKIAANATHHDPSRAAMTPRQVFDAQVKSGTPLGRPQTPEDIGRAVAFFASDDASEITGQALNVNGGTIMN